MASRTVLIVDDHAGFRQMARRLLESEGFSVVGEAVDGRTAAQRIAELRPQIVLLDVQLPDMTGIELASRLTAEGSAVEIVLTSSRDAGDLPPSVSSCGARGFIPKAELSAAGLEEVLA